MQCLHFNEINSHLTIDEQLNLSNNRYQQLGSLNNSHDNIMLLKALMLFNQVSSRRNS